MSDPNMFFFTLKLLEVCSKENFVNEFIDRQKRSVILKERHRASPQLIIKTLMNIIIDDVLGSEMNTSAKCLYPSSEECNSNEITLTTLKALTLYGIEEKHWAIPFIEAAIFKLLENNNKAVVQEDENIIVEYINKSPLKNFNPRSLLRKNQALKKKHI